jgi:hypothetical protein
VSGASWGGPDATLGQTGGSGGGFLKPPEQQLPAAGLGRPPAQVRPGVPLRRQPGCAECTSYR